MATGDHKTLRGVAVVGGGALLFWLLWRWRGNTGEGGPGSHPGHGDRDVAGVAAEPVHRRVVVWIRGGDQVELEGVRLDLATAVAQARVAGAAEVHTTGDARWGWVQEVVRRLSDAGVDLSLDATLALDLGRPTIRVPLNSSLGKSR